MKMNKTMAAGGMLLGAGLTAAAMFKVVPAIKNMTSNMTSNMTNSMSNKKDSSGSNGSSNMSRNSML
ncbi:MAG: hypothetical protein AAGU76_01885 [Sedimentibacter sp.]|uniref:hypothetical protein n=1 Tax=Sedimentibacter sp. TaxID=1960295 RepID=UPI0031588DDF